MVWPRSPCNTILFRFFKQDKARGKKRVSLYNNHCLFLVGIVLFCFFKEL